MILDSSKSRRIRNSSTTENKILLDFLNIFYKPIGRIRNSKPMNSELLMKPPDHASESLRMREYFSTRSSRRNNFLDILVVLKVVSCYFILKI